MKNGSLVKINQFKHKKVNNNRDWEKIRTKFERTEPEPKRQNFLFPKNPNRTEFSLNENSNRNRTQISWFNPIHFFFHLLTIESLYWRLDRRFRFNTWDFFS